MKTIEYYLSEIEKLENEDVLKNKEIELTQDIIDGDIVDLTYLEIERERKITRLHDEAIKIAPNNSDLYLKKAQHLNSCPPFPNLLEETNQILDLLDKAIELDSKNANSYFIKAGELRKNFIKESVPSIVGCYDMAIKLEPNNATYYIKKSSFCYEAKNYPLGEKLYKKSIELKQEDLDFIVNNTVQELLVYGRDFEVVKIYDDLIRENPDLPDLYYHRANAKAYGDFYKDASYYNEDWSRNEYLGEEMDYLMKNYQREVQEKQFRKEALDDINKALELRPDEKDYLELKENIISSL